MTVGIHNIAQLQVAMLQGRQPQRVRLLVLLKDFDRLQYKVYEGCSQCGKKVDVDTAICPKCQCSGARSLCYRLRVLLHDHTGETWVVAWDFAAMNLLQTHPLAISDEGGNLTGCRVLDQLVNMPFNCEVSVVTTPGYRVPYVRLDSARPVEVAPRPPPQVASPVSQVAPSSISEVAAGYVAFVMVGFVAGAMWGFIALSLPVWVLLAFVVYKLHGHRAA